jgi:hypothetical protein
MTAAGQRDVAARAAELVGLFVTPAEEFGTIVPIAAERVPEPFRSLLDHDGHMTEAMERHHGGEVTLRVVSEAVGPGDRYAREILLDRPGGGVVQHGIVRLDLGAVDATSADRIRAHAAPLGRILAEAGMLCRVSDVELVQVVPGPHLRPLIGARPTFGRVAGISVDGRPAVELLEIVAAG